MKMLSWVLLLLSCLLVPGVGLAEESDRGTIRVLSPVQMRIFLDGSAVESGITPCELRQVIPGTHHIVARAEGYRDCVFTLTVLAHRVSRAELQPVSSSLRVGLSVDVQGFDQRIWGPISERWIHCRIDLNRAALFSHLQNQLAQAPGIQVVENAPADLQLRASFQADKEDVHGTFTLVDRQGVVLGSETRSVGMPMGIQENMSPAAMKRANEIIDNSLPSVVQKIVQRAGAAGPPPMVITE